MAVSQEKQKEQALNMESVTWGDLTWINIVRPTEREMKYLADNYPFHPMDLEDCLSRRQQPKLDVYEGYLFFIFHFSVWDRASRVSRPDQVSVFIGDKYLITIHDGLLKTLVALFRQCQTDEETRRENLSHGSGYLLYRILDRVTDAYFPVLNSILAWVDDVEDAVFDENVSAVRELAVLRRDIITQRRIFHSIRPVYAVLENKIKRFCKIDITVQFGDLIDHVNKICEALDEAKEVVDLFKDTDNSFASERMNEILRVLTILATISTVLTFVVGFYGMNIPLPLGSDPGGHPLAWVLFLLLSILIAALMLLYFHRKRWI